MVETKTEVYKPIPAQNLPRENLTEAGGVLTNLETTTSPYSIVEESTSTEEAKASHSSDELDASTPIYDSTNGNLSSLSERVPLDGVTSSTISIESTEITSDSHDVHSVQTTSAPQTTHDVQTTTPGDVQTTILDDVQSTSDDAQSTYDAQTTHVPHLSHASHATPESDVQRIVSQEPTVSSTLFDSTAYLDRHTIQTSDVSTISEAATPSSFSISSTEATPEESDGSHTPDQLSDTTPEVVTHTDVSMPETTYVSSVSPPEPVTHSTTILASSEVVPQSTEDSQSIEKHDGTSTVQASSQQTILFSSTDGAPTPTISSDDDTKADTVIKTTTHPSQSSKY